jgi:hypothetical protein
MTLLELQREIAGTIMAPVAFGHPESLIKSNSRMTPRERLDIYRRSYWCRVLDSLTEDFPGLRAMLGQRAFHRLAQAYLRDCPSQSFTLRDLGSRLGDWLLQNRTHAGANLRLALDMVCLEWAHIEAFDAADEKPLGPEDLLELGSDVRFGLQPHIQLIELRYPVDDLRIRAEELSNERMGGRRIMSLSQRLSPEPIFLAVHRTDFTVFYRRLAMEEFHVLENLRRGAPIGEALASLSAADAVETWFAVWSRLGWLCQPRQLISA